MMATLVPETLTRLQATLFVHDVELSNLDRGRLLREAARNMAEAALQKLISDCITPSGNYQGHPSPTLMLDVYVLAPHELHQIIAQARAEGQEDARRWNWTTSGLE